MDEKIIEQLFTSYKSKTDSKTDIKNSLTLYIKSMDMDMDMDMDKSKISMKNTDDFEILFSMFCS